MSEADELAAAWSRRRTSRWQDWPAGHLAERKKRLGVTVSVVIPARDEERTVAAVVTAIARLAADTGLVDEIVVIDSDSSDATSAVAAKAGATVYRAGAVAPQLGAFPGKGEALWKSLLVTEGDLLVFVDADLTHWGPHFVTGLLGPLLDDPGVLLVKGFYERLYAGDDGSVSADGGRVTELVARPLLSLWWPELTGVVQPLAGEWAARRDLMESLSIPVGYGIELAVLLDTARNHGLEATPRPRFTCGNSCVPTVKCGSVRGRSRWMSGRRPVRCVTTARHSARVPASPAPPRSRSRDARLPSRPLVWHGERRRRGAARARTAAAAQ